MVRPQLEYASDVWDPHQTGDIVELEKIQRRAARWVVNDYDYDYDYILGRDSTADN